MRFSAKIGSRKTVYPVSSGIKPSFFISLSQPGGPERNCLFIPLTLMCRSNVFWLQLLVLQ